MHRDCEVKSKPFFIELNFIDESKRTNTKIVKCGTSSINKLAPVSIKEIGARGRGTCKLGIADPDSKYIGGPIRTHHYSSDQIIILVGSLPWSTKANAIVVL